MMPVAPRPPGKGKKIAYVILGVPQNMQETKKEGIVGRNTERIIKESTITQR